MRIGTTLTTAIVALLASTISHSASAETILEWKFDDPAGTPLSALATSPAEFRFHRDAPGVEANGNGQLLVRNTNEAPNLYYAPVPDSVSEQPIWMIVELDSWVTAGKETDEGIRVGLSSGKKVADQLVGIRLTRDSNTRAQLTVRAGGDAGDSYSASDWIPLPVKTGIEYGLYYDSAQHLYAIFSKEENGKWTQRGYGMTDPERGTPKYLRLNLFGHFTDSEDESMLLGGITIQTDPPVPGLEPEFIMPKVTADSWVVANAQTGEIIASRGLHEPRKTASITKIMNTYTVLKLAEQDPGLLDERVTFSELASATRGSTADVEPGESVLMSDLLYGFMLPSGNDAGNAIAEHLSSRVAPPGPREKYPASMETRKNFVAEMNRNAKLLGMKDTTYRIPYGDGGFATERTTSLADLLLLADASMKMPLFRKIVSTQEYKAPVTLPNGSTRTAVWNNTNKFLGEPGFAGIKTGTTGQAGACIFVAYVKDGTGYYIAVLGSDGADQRYTDVRALIEHYL